MGSFTTTCVWSWTTPSPRRLRKNSDVKQSGRARGRSAGSVEELERRSVLGVVLTPVRMIRADLSGSRQDLGAVRWHTGHRGWDGPALQREGGVAGELAGGAIPKERLGRGPLGVRRTISHRFNPRRAMTRPFTRLSPIWLVAAIALGAAAAPPGAGAVLNVSDFRHYVDQFNTMAPEDVVNAIPNAAAWEWLTANVPFFACPDRELERTYYYRWWAWRKHLKRTPKGWVITEFLRPVA